MRKTRPPALRLSSETIRPLAGADLRRAAGGDSTGATAKCPQTSWSGKATCATVIIVVTITTDIV